MNDEIMNPILYLKTHVYFVLVLQSAEKCHYVSDKALTLQTLVEIVVSHLFQFGILTPAKLQNLRFCHYRNLCSMA